MVSADGLHQLDEDIEASIDAVAARLQATLDELANQRGLHAELLCIDGVAADVVPQYARYADLCILGSDEPQGPASIGYTFSEQICS